MKYTILIADDEPLARRGLKNLIHGRCGDWEVRATCADGSQALAAATSERYDAALVDIRMPRVDGLQLAGSLRKASPDTVIIVMSGYREFDYAHRALKNGVFDFLVKPIEEEELFAALDRACDEIQRRRSARQQAVVTRDPDVIGDALLSEVLTAPNPGEAGARLCEFLGIELVDFFVVCAQAVRPQPAEEGMDVERVRVRGRLVDGPFAGRRHVLCFQDHLVIIAMAGGGNDAGVQCANAVAGLLDGHARVGVSCAHQGGAALRTAYEEAACAMRAGFYGGPGEISRFVPVEPSVLAYPSVAVERLVGSLLAADCAASEANARDLLGAYSRLRVSPRLFDEHLRAALLQIQDKLSPFLPDIDDLRARLESLTPAEKHGWFDVFQTELLRTMGDLCEKVAKANQSRLTRVVMRAIHYIEENYGRDLPLEEIARSVALSPSYFSSTFKKQIGKNVVEYITEFRMEKAAEMLCSTNLNASEVAYRVGFNDPKYFARIFKRSLGVTPSEYRKYSRDA